MLRSISRLARPALACAVLWLIASPSYLAASFVDVSDTAGLRVAATELPATGGVWVVDINKDGWPDIYVTRTSGGSHLFVNQKDGTFVESAAEFGLAGPEGAHAALFGDPDNDGDVDLFVGLLEGTRHYFYRNDGNGQFSEQAQELGLDLPDTQLAHRVYGATWSDFDLDGYLDLHTSEWFNVGTSVDPSLHTTLLRNLGAANPGHFENVTETAGVAIATDNNRQHAFASAFADFDQDGWPDLIVTGDFGTSRYFRNNADGTFTDRTKTANFNKAQAAMGIAVGDYDGDLYLDIFETSIYDNPGFPVPLGHTGNRLYRYRPEQSNFAELSGPLGLRDSGFAWGATFFDFDNDGDQDLVATNSVAAFYGSLPEKTRLWINEGDGSFTDSGDSLGIVDEGEGYGIATLDYDRDGDLDLLIGQRGGGLILYRNDQAFDHDWLRLSLEGTLSNRDAIGTKVIVKADSGRSQYFEYNPSNLFMAQSEAILHIGLGPNTPQLNELTILWPSGVAQTLQNITARQTLHLIEPESKDLAVPSITRQPTPQVITRGNPLALQVEATGAPPPAIQWYRDDEPIVGATGSSLVLDSIRPHQAGIYQARVSNAAGSLFSQPAEVGVGMGDIPYTVARWWNELLLDAIRTDFPAPTVHARNLYHTSAAMWDAFWAYEIDGWLHSEPLFRKESPLENGALSPSERRDAQAEAISYAAFRVLTERYRESDGGAAALQDFSWLMESLGYDPDFGAADGSSPAAVGNRIAASLLAVAINDGANETGSYLDPDGYAAVNDPLNFAKPGVSMSDPNRWQPLLFDRQVTQNGIELDATVQQFVGSHWGQVAPFALESVPDAANAFDPGAPPYLDEESHAAFVANAVEVIRFSSLLDPSDDTRIDISPSARFNNSLGENDGRGYPQNPATGRAYPPNEVKRADYARVLAEFWADGPSSETPPGHWNALLNQVTDHPDFHTRYAGHGEPLPRLQWQIMAYLALNGAMHDAAIAAWRLKERYDYARPISMIRYLGSLGQSNDPDSPSYHPQGLPLIPDLIALVTLDSAAPGQPHEHLAAHLGEIAIRAWRGEPEDTHSQSSGVGWIRAAAWMPYQRSTFVTPAFAAYISGHSCFSRAGAEVLTLLTGSRYFPGGLGTHLFRAYDYLEFESGPSEAITLQWATYYDAADQAGLSRLYGGIHVAPDDIEGRRIGAKIGLAAFLRLQRLQSAGDTPPALEDLAISSFGNDIGPQLIAAFQPSDGQAIPLIASATRSSQPHGVMLQPSNDGEALRIVSSSETKIAAVSAIATSQGLEITFRVKGLTPQAIFARALGETNLFPVHLSASNASPLELYQLDDNGHPQPAASNSVWWQQNLASLAFSASELFRGPHAPLEATDAALFAVLQPGNYLLRVSPTAQSKRRAVELRAL